MSALIDWSTGRPAIAIANDGEIPWHGDYNRMPLAATMADWIDGGGIGYEVLSGEVVIHTEDNQQIELPGRKGLYRSDTGAALADVSKQYQTHQPHEFMQMIWDLCNDLNFNMETVGALNDGKKIWVQAKCPEDFVLPGNDITKTFLLMATSFDCSMASLARYVNTRTVCQNTLTAAAAEATSHDVRVSHRSKFDVKSIKEQLGLSVAVAEHMHKVSEEMTRADVSPQQAQAFYYDLLGADAFSWTEYDNKKAKEIQKAGDVEKARSIETAQILQLAPSPKYKQILDCLVNGPGQELESCSKSNTVKTVYGLLNAVTDYADHHHSSDKNRINSSMFGEGEKLKNEAFTLAQQAIAA